MLDRWKFKTSKIVTWVNVTENFTLSSNFKEYVTVNSKNYNTVKKYNTVLCSL